MSRGFDAPSFRRALAAFLDALREHADEIDSLNVYPVPDGDTGTNLLLTQQAVGDALAALGAEADAAAVADTVATASLRGARGNSGVILSQVLRGLAGTLTSGGPSLDEALRAASDMADRAVARPVDGTTLSVLRAAAQGAAASPGQT